MERLILLLLCLCSYCSGQECRTELERNSGFMGSVLETIFSADAEHCQLLCTDHPRCQFFMFYRQEADAANRFHCQLKSTSTGEPITKAEIPTVTSGYSLKPCPTYTAPCLRRLYPKVEFIHSSYDFVFTPDALECQRVCTQHPDCSFFTWTSPQHKDQDHRFICLLMFSWKVPRIPVVEQRSRVISGFNHMTDFRITTSIEDCAVTILSDTDFRQGASQLSKEPAVNAEHCQALCSAHPVCTHYTYERPYCFILKRTNSISTNATGLISGVPARFCLQDNKWLGELYPGLGFPGSDIKMVPINDGNVLKCREACSVTPDCQFFSFVTKENRGACYLKAVITAPAPDKVVETENVVSGFSLRGQ